FVKAVYLYDDHITLTFDINDGTTEDVEISMDDVEQSLCENVRLNSVAGHQKEKGYALRILFLFFDSVCGIGKAFAKLSNNSLFHSIGQTHGFENPTKADGSSLTGGSEDSAVAACGRRIPVEKHRVN
ncbi:MAG: hypothetical protein IKA76_04965, partial [Clostridia bacterium]|nr:hypothetical protein [Clostridia bacterium]